MTGSHNHGLEYSEFLSRQERNSEPETIRCACCGYIDTDISQFYTKDNMLMCNDCFLEAIAEDEREREERNDFLFTLLNPEE